MANPQQPELRRSEQVPALSPDAAAAEVEARKTPGRRAEPDERSAGLDRPPDRNVGDGQTGDSDEDQPDLDRFAEAYGVPPEDGDDAPA